MNHRLVNRLNRSWTEAGGGAYAPDRNAKPSASMPTTNRGSMTARPWRGFLGGVLVGWIALATRLAGSDDPQRVRFDDEAPAPTNAASTAAWKRAAAHRRRALLALIALSVFSATAVLDQALAAYGNDWLRTAQISLFSILFGWVSAGFYTAMMGFWVQWRGDPHALSSRSVAHHPIAADARTALVMPICNEQVSTVFAGLRATVESLIAAGGARLFDVYLLSDASEPAIRTAELAAWAELRDTMGASTRIHYRWRQRRTQRKSGNVADFCRRWGRNYRYMVVLDADSVMTGDCLLSLVRLMEAHPDAGIIQTAPQASGLSTIHARAQQFAGRVTGRLFSAGMQYWQLGESHYWGHNAILRVAPFMKHCALAPLPGRGGLSGHILSHDFVEAALMRRAGYHVWLVNDLEGSYEQQPPNLLEELHRDRRWCQGNLQNARLLAEPGLHGVHRVMLVTGALAYLSAPLWLAYVLLGVALWLFGGHPAFSTDALVPVEIMALWVGTLAMLVMPRTLGVVTIVLRGEQALYGGSATLVRGALLEGTLSVLQAPLRMIAHTIFVIVALTGLKLDWKSPPREANDIGWADASNRFALIGATVLAMGAAALAMEPATLLWLAPVGVPLLLAVPLAVLTSRAGLGERVRQLGLLVTPEETRTPTVLREAAAYVRQNSRRQDLFTRWRDALDNPWLFGVVQKAMGSRSTMWGQRGRARRQLVGRLRTENDVDSLSVDDQMRLLSEPQHLVRLRDQLMSQAEPLHAAHYPEGGKRRASSSSWRRNSSFSAILASSPRGTG
ncbi:MAG: glucans biosynthesis glucosyltransferase MdoH [Burkholderiales bacterium]